MQNFENKKTVKELSKFKKTKKKYVKQMFNDISKTYDLINMLSSFGIDRYWRNCLIQKVKLSYNHKLLDVATGTGDVAFKLASKCNQVIGLDIAENMIKLAKVKQSKKQIGFRSTLCNSQNEIYDIGTKILFLQ